MTGADQLVGQLTDALNDRGLAGSVDNLRRLSGGASRETWAFDLAGEALILQRERPGGVRTGGGMAGEARLLRLAAAAGVPVPEVLATDDGRSDLDAPFVVTRHVDGEAIPRRLLRNDEFATVRPRLAREAGAALACVHSIDPGSVADVLDAPDQIVQFREILDLIGEPHPALELGFRWLERHRPESPNRSVVHGDFRTGNLLVDPGGLTAVLDWELSHLGDPVEDLGWFCVRAWRFGSPHRAGGFGSVDDLLAGYVEGGGARVAPAALDWWQAMGTLKWAVMCKIQAATHLSGASRSVELAAIGRRTCENEWDLLDLIAPEVTAGVRRDLAARPLEPSSAWSAPGSRPTASELAEAVREYLDGDVSGATSGRVRFHARVASNVMRMIERELAVGPAVAARHADRLSVLGCADEAALAAAIRSGDLDEADAIPLVAAAIADQLAIANPGYEQTR